MYNKSTTADHRGTESIALTSAKRTLHSVSEAALVTPRMFHGNVENGRELPAFPMVCQ